MARRLAAAPQLARQLSLLSTREFSAPTFSTAAQPVRAAESGGWQAPFSQPLAGFETVGPAAAVAHADPFATALTTLESGLRIATEPAKGDFCTLGILIDAGSRYEVAYPSGITHFLEKLAFMSTAAFPTRDALYATLEAASGICDAQGQKDTFVYAASCHVDGVDSVLGIIADSALRPRIDAEEFALAQQILAFELGEMEQRPERDAALHDLIHAAAFRGNTLGLPKICPAANVDKMSREALFAFLSTHFRPERMVVAGVGVDHDRLVAAARKHLEVERPIWETDPTATLPATAPVPKLDTSTAQYTGGCIKVEKDLSVFDFGPSPFPNLAHVVLGLQGASFKDADFVPLCVLHSLLGGGGSFSAGGPGKGMYTRLYTDVLNRYHYFYSATAMNHSYADGGVFCITASAPPEKLGEATAVLVSQLLRLAAEPGAEELSRAKNQLKSMLMMNLEARPTMFEDMARQILGHGYRKSPYAYIQEIEAVTAPQLQAVGLRMLASRPSLVGYGDLSKLPDYEKVDEAIATKSTKGLEAGRFRLFKS